MTRHDLVQELVNDLCSCGRKKKRGESFCRPCYFELPRKDARALYRRVGEGYEAAYQRARTLLGRPVEVEAES